MIAGAGSILWGKTLQWLTSWVFILVEIWNAQTGRWGGGVFAIDSL